MKWVGLTGGIGTGKSTVSEILQQKGLPVISADAYAHKILEQKEIIEKLILYFGSDIISSEDQETSKIIINRKILGDIVFSSPQKKSILEKVLHPIIKTMVSQKKEHLEKLKTPLAIYDVPLLFEKNMQAEFDYILLVAANKEVVYKRLEKSRSITKKMFELIVNSQMPQEEKLKLTPLVIWNNGTIEELESQCGDILKKIDSIIPINLSTKDL